MSGVNNKSNETDEIKNGTAMAVSGGGFRATLFHLGSFWRLNELGYLSQLKRICSVSGGSLTNGLIGMKWNSLKFVDGVAVNFEEEVVRPLTKFCSKTVDLPAALGGWLSLTKHPGSKLAEAYEELFQGATLQDLPETKNENTDKNQEAETQEEKQQEEGSQENGPPEFLIYATNLQTGVSFRFTRDCMGDYKIGWVSQPRVPLATAVAASCAFPPVFTPIILKFQPSDYDKEENAYLYQDKELRPDIGKLRQTVYLSDGGVYDNLGLEAIWKTYSTVLVSDAGAPFEVVTNPLLLRLSHIKKILRVLYISMNQNRALRKRWLIDDFINDEKFKGAYWGVASDINKYDLDEAFVRDNVESVKLSKLRTRLNRFTQAEQGKLINWGYALADAAIRKHVDNDIEKPDKWPIEKYRLNQYKELKENK